MKTAIQQITDDFEGRYITTAFMPLSMAKKFHKLWANTNGKNRYSHLFEQFTTKRPAYRIYLPIAKHLRINTKSSPVEIEVINTLHNYAQGKYDLLDYFAGRVLEKASGRIMTLGRVLEIIKTPLVKQAIAAATNTQIFNKINDASFTVPGDAKGEVINRYQMFNESTRSGIPFKEFLDSLDIPKLVKVKAEILKIEADKEKEYQELVAKMKAEGKGAPRRKDEPVDIAGALKKHGFSGPLVSYFAGVVAESVKAEKAGKPSALPQRASALSTEQKEAILADAVVGGGQLWDAKLFKVRKIDRLFLEGLSWTPVDAVQNRFADDPTRRDADATNSDMAIVISRHPYDVATVSTGRQWTSCLNLGNVKPHTGRGSNAHRIPASIRYGSIVAYGIRADDGNIKKPVCRMTLMPFVNTKDPDDIILDVSSSSNYGTMFPGFERTLRMWLALVNHGNKGGTYKIINTKPYADVGGDRSWPSFSQDQDIDSWCTKLGISKYTVKDGYVSVKGDVKINNQGLDKRFNTLPIKFAEVTGDFDISNATITSLAGVPKKIGKSFIASRSAIASLEDGPESVGENYLVDQCLQLQNLVGFPKSIGGDFSVSGCKNLMSLRGISSDSVVEGSFEAKQTGLRRIDAFPQVNCKVTKRWQMLNPLDKDPEALGMVDFSACDIQTTVGLPEVIEGDLLLKQNRKLEDLVGFPKLVKGHVSLSDCPLHDLSQLNNTTIAGTLQFSDGDLVDADVEKLRPVLIGGGIQFSSHRLTKNVKLPPNVKYGLWLGNDQSEIVYGDPDKPKVFLKPFDQRDSKDIRSELYKARLDRNKAAK